MSGPWDRPPSPNPDDEWPSEDLREARDRWTPAEPAGDAGGGASSGWDDWGSTAPPDDYLAPDPDLPTTDLWSESWEDEAAAGGWAADAPVEPAPSWEPEPATAPVWQPDRAATPAWQPEPEAAPGWQPEPAATTSWEPEPAQAAAPEPAVVRAGAPPESPPPPQPAATEEPGQAPVEPAPTVPHPEPWSFDADPWAPEPAADAPVAPWDPPVEPEVDALPEPAKRSTDADADAGPLETTPDASPPPTIDAVAPQPVESVAEAQLEPEPEPTAEPSPAGPPAAEPSAGQPPDRGEPPADVEPPIQPEPQQAVEPAIAAGAEPEPDAEPPARRNRWWNPAAWGAEAVAEPVTEAEVVDVSTPEPDVGTEDRAATVEPATTPEGSATDPVAELEAPPMEEADAADDPARVDAATATPPVAEPEAVEPAETVEPPGAEPVWTPEPWPSSVQPQLEALFGSAIPPTTTDGSATQPTTDATQPTTESAAADAPPTPDAEPTPDAVVTPDAEPTWPAELEGTQVFPSSWTPPTPRPRERSSELQPESAPIRTTLSASGAETEPGEEPTTAEQAVPWLIGVILLLAGMVIVLLALIFAGDASLGSEIPVPSGSSLAVVPSGSQPATARATPRPTNDASAEPSTSVAPTPTPLAIPEYGPLEMVYLGRSAALAHIYLLHHDFTVVGEPTVLAQDPTLDLRMVSWSPDGMYGAGLYTDLLISIQSGEEKRRLGDSISTITFGPDPATLYAVRITADGANDVATVLSIDYATGDTTELSSVSYPRPATRSQDALAEAQFIDDGGPVRLFWLESGALRLWIRDGGVWEVDPVAGDATPSDGDLPKLWSGRGNRHVVVSREGTTTTLTLTDRSGEAMATTSIEGLVSHLRWSPDSDRVVFTVGRSAPAGGVLQDLFLWDLGDGEAPTQLTATGAAFSAEWRGAMPVWRE